MADPNPSAKMERKTQRRPAEIKPRIIERRGKKGGKPMLIIVLSYKKIR